MKKLLFAFTFGALAFGCKTMMEGPTAVARLESRSGSTASGTVWFTQVDERWTRVKIDIQGVTPGTHGFHVHEKGDCSSPDSNAAGGHFNPTAAPHGPHAMTSHAGDFGNVTAREDGAIRSEFMTESVTVNPGERSVVGRAVVLHAAPDDLTSQPTGNSGARIACGVATLSP